MENKERTQKQIADDISNKAKELNDLLDEAKKNGLKANFNYFGEHFNIEVYQVISSSQL